MGVGDSLIAMTVFSLAYHNLVLDWGATQWTFFGLALFSGVIIETTIAWIIAMVAFWTGRSLAIHNVSTQFHFLAQQYPLDIFGSWYRAFVTGFLPVAFINYYPLTLLLGKSNAVGWPLLGFLSPLVAVFLVALGGLVWRRALVQYTSSGN